MTLITDAPTVAIVGGGALGAALVGLLVDRLSSRSWAVKPHIVLVEKSEHIGRGVAYARDSAPYLLNTSAQTMSLVRGRPTQFFEWLAQRGLATPEEGDLFCARQLFGDYVEDCFAHALDRARRHGIGVSTIRDEVVSLAPRSVGGYRVVTSTNPPVDADVAVLALGNLPSNRFASLAGPGFISSPYPSDALRTCVPARSRVAIVGAGLGAIDAALALFAAGHEGPVTMASRSGMLPAVRGPLHDHELRFVTHANVMRATDQGRRPLGWSTVLCWLERELEAQGQSVAWDRDFPAWAPPAQHLADEIAAAEQGPRPWQSIGEALNPLVEVVWHHLSDDDRGLFLERFRSRFMSHWVPIPLVTARRLFGLVDRGALRVERGLTGVTRDPSSGSFALQLGDRRAEADVVVNATGAPWQLSEVESPLVEALLAQGIIAARETGGVRVAFDTLQVLAADGRPDPSLFLLGHLTCGTHLFTSTLERNVEKADRVATHVTEELHRRLEKKFHVDAAPHSS